MTVLTLVDPNDPTDPLPRQVFDWLHEMRASGAFRPSTISAYESTYRLFLAFLDRHQHTTVTKEVVTAFVRGARNRRGDGPALPATVNRYCAALSTLYKWLVQEGRAPFNPCEFVLLPAVRNTNPRPIPLRTWMAVWNLPTLTQEDRVMLGLGYYVGLRRFEIVEVPAAKFDLDGRLIVNYVRKGGGFDVTPYGEMIDYTRFKLQEHATPNLERFEADLRYLATTSPGRLLPLGDVNTDPGWVNKRVAELIAEAGLPEGAFTPHAMRHSCVTNLLEAGVELHYVAALVSHSDTKTTRRYTTGSGVLARQLQQEMKAQANQRGYDPDWWKR